MPCPVHNGDNDDISRDESGANGGFQAEDSQVDRRSFMKSALVIGGASALSTVTSMFGMSGTAAATGEDRVSIADRNNRQHAWDVYQQYVESRQQAIPPTYHLILLADYDHSGEPSPGHRKRVAEAFEQIEAAFDWSHDGILFTAGYSLEYFERFDETLPAGLDPRVEPKAGSGLMSAETLINTGGVTLPREDPSADSHDLCLHLASDHVQNLLAVEQALWGEKSEINGVTFTATLDGIFTQPESYPERRVGFVGHDALEEQGGVSDENGVYPSTIPDDADLSMGFNTLFRNSVPRETDATMLEDQFLVEPKPPGMFAQGTIQHVSKLDIELGGGENSEGGWYDELDLDQRRQQMFSSEHTAENTGTVGEKLGNSNAPDEKPMRNLSSDDQDIAELTDDHAAELNRVGHVQKVSRARFDRRQRLTDEGRTRLSGGDNILPADEYDQTIGTGGKSDDLPGHDGDQKAEQTILRRDIDTVDQATPGNHFIGLMRFAPYMAYMRQAMNGIDFSTEPFGLPEDQGGFTHSGSVPDENSGILDFLTTQRRGNFLVPPITLRALPHPQSEDVDLTVSTDGDSYTVETSDLSRGQIETETVRFGWFYEVNSGSGASPSAISNRGGTLTLEFPADETSIEAAPGGPDGEGDVRLRLFAKRGADNSPVRGTVNLQAVQTDSESEDDQQGQESKESAEKEDRGQNKGRQNRGQSQNPPGK